MPTGSFKTGPTSYLLMAPECMVYWRMASAPVIGYHGKEIAGNGILRLRSPWIAPREPCHLLGIAGLVWQVPWCSPPASWPPIIKWMWRIPWMLWLLAVITFVVLRIRYPVGGDITISPMCR
jgi:hypothetical protein